MTKSEMAEAAERMFRLVKMDDGSAALIRKAVADHVLTDEDKNMAPKTDMELVDGAMRTLRLTDMMRKKQQADAAKLEFKLGEVNDYSKGSAPNPLAKTTIPPDADASYLKYLSFRGEMGDYIVSYSGNRLYVGATQTGSKAMGGEKHGMCDLRGPCGLVEILKAARDIIRDLERTS